MKENYDEELNKVKKTIKEKKKSVNKLKHRMKRIGKALQIINEYEIDSFRYYLDDDHYMIPLSTGAIAIRDKNSYFDVVFSPRIFSVKAYLLNNYEICGGTVSIKYYNVLIDNFDKFEKAFYDTVNAEFEKINDTIN